MDEICEGFASMNQGCLVLDFGLISQVDMFHPKVMKQVFFCFFLFDVKYPAKSAV